MDLEKKIVAYDMVNNWTYIGEAQYPAPATAVIDLRSVLVVSTEQLRNDSEKTLLERYLNLRRQEQGAKCELKSKVDIRVENIVASYVLKENLEELKNDK